MISDEKIRILVIEPMKFPYSKEIDNELSALQKEVGGYIEAIYPFADDVAIIVNEEGKIKGEALNRVLYDEDGNVIDVIAGTFIVAGLSDEDFGSLTELQEERYSEMFRRPEAIICDEEGVRAYEL